jgi:hypothetical protein
MSFLLNQVFGKIVKVGGLMGRPDLLFVYDADEIEKVSLIGEMFRKVEKLLRGLHAFQENFRGSGDLFEHFKTSLSDFQVLSCSKELDKLRKQ